MRITFKRANPSLPEYKKLKKLYTSSFPRDERAPFYLLASKRSRSNVDFWAIYADDKWAGLAYTVSRRDVCYLFYFVIAHELRGRGIGTKALRALVKLYGGQKLFLALEPVDKNAPNYEERVKRRDFYLRCGLSPVDVTITEGSVVYDVMSAGGDISPFDYGMMMHYYLGFPVNRLIKTRMTPKKKEKDPNEIRAENRHRRA